MKRPSRVRRRGFRGQAMTEFALVAPLLFLVVAAVFLAFLYAWRTFNTDWLLFASGVAQGVYETPRGEQSLAAAVWDDLKQAVRLGAEGRTAEAAIRLKRRGVGPWGLLVEERQAGRTVFFLWRFYPGPEGKR